MKLNTIKNAYIKNLPNYNYTIKDQDGLLIATGHLMSNRDKQQLTEYIITNIDQNGKTNTTISDPLSLSAKTILLSLDSWQLQLPLTTQTIQGLDPDVISWLVSQINNINFSSIAAVQSNEKN